MKIENRVVEQTITCYVAKDGREFFAEHDCEEYEKVLLRKEMLEGFRKIVNSIRLDVPGYLPCDGEEHADNANYNWYKVNNLEELAALNAVYGIEMELEQFPDIVCLEDYSENNYIATLTECKDYVTKLFDAFGYEVTFTERLEAGESEQITECCPHCEQENTIMWDVKASGYKAYCSYCGSRLMLCSMCDSRCDYDSEIDSCTKQPKN